MAATDAPPERPAAAWRRVWDRVWPPLSGTVAVRAIFGFFEDGMGDYAAALTYHALLSIFPGLLVGFAVFGLVGDATLPHRAADALLSHGTNPETAQVANDVLDQMLNASTGALSAALLVSVALAVYGASGAFLAAGRALNAAFEYEETRGFWKPRLVSLGVTVVIVLLWALVVGAVFLGDSWARSVLGWIGLGDAAADAWNLLRWPVALAAAMLGNLIVYRLAPCRPAGAARTKLLSLGAVVSVLLWLGATVLFRYYVGNFSRYGAVYGVAGSLIVLLLWLYLSNTAFLYGAQINAEIARRRAGRAKGAAAA